VLVRRKDRDENGGLPTRRNSATVLAPGPTEDQVGNLIARSHVLKEGPDHRFDPFPDIPLATEVKVASPVWWINVTDDFTGQVDPEPQ